MGFIFGHIYQLEIIRDNPDTKIVQDNVTCDKCNTETRVLTVFSHFRISKNDPCDKLSFFLAQCNLQNLFSIFLSQLPRLSMYLKNSLRISIHRLTPVSYTHLTLPTIYSV